MKRGVIFLGEVAAVALFRLTCWWTRSSVLPKGSKVQRIKNRPVLRLPAFKRPRRKPRKKAGMHAPRRIG